MYRLLIVDDEAHIVDWLFELFSDYRGAELDLYRAYSGSEALQCLNTNKADIVLTDIRMPGMDGFELVAEIREKWPACKIIFLTGYDDFNYVYNAIKYEGTNYVLKNEDDEVIIQSVTQAIEQIEEGRRTDKLLERAKEQIRWAAPILQQEFMAELLSGELEDEPVSQSQFDELGIPLRADQPVLLIMSRMDHRFNKRGKVEEKRRLYQINIIMEKYLQSRTMLFFAKQTPRCMVWMIQPLLDPESLGISNWQYIQLYVKEILEDVQQSVRESLGFSSSYMLSPRPVAWEELPSHYADLKLQFDLNIGISKEIIMTGLDERMQASGKSDQPDDQSRQIRAVINKVPTLGAYLEQGKDKPFMALLQEMKYALVSQPDQQYGLAQELYYHIALTILTYMNRMQLASYLASRMELSPLMNITSHESWSAAMDYLQQLAELIFEQMTVRHQEKSELAIETVKDYIDQHLHEDLSLAKLADHVYYNPSYLSRLFKQMTNMTISDYIFERKVARAKALLSQSQYKIYEIGNAIGYPSPSYFANFFRKATGMSPQSYRDNVLTGKQNATK